MANTTIKISQLPNVGNLTTNTLFPVVSTNGTLITDKINLGNLANFVLTEAGNLLQTAFVAEIAYGVANAAQPNITSVGTLNNLDIIDVSALHIPGGANGYVLQTNGNGNLNWVSLGTVFASGPNNSIQFNNDGLLDGNASLSFDVANSLLTTDNIKANYSNIDSIYVGNDITLSTGGNIYETGNVLIVRTEATHIFEIWGNDGASDYKWSFDQDGHLTLPGNTAYLRGDVNLMQFYCNSDNQSGVSLFSNFELSASDDVKIYSNNDSIPFVWIFDSTGNLTLPSSNIAINFANGDPVFSNMVSWTTPPDANNSPGAPGQSAYDSNGNLYVCVATDTWAKFAGTTSW